MVLLYVCHLGIYNANIYSQYVCIYIPVLTPLAWMSCELTYIGGKNFS